jgi:hypothetical protein
MPESGFPVCIFHFPFFISHSVDVAPMAKTYTQPELEAYLDEALPPEQMARIELALRSDADLVRQLATINARRDAGVHSLGEIWRRHRLSCATREQLGSYLLGVLSKEAADYLGFHLEVMGCRVCRANLSDLQKQQAETGDTAQTRRRKYFQSSAGYLRPGK